MMRKDLPARRAGRSPEPTLPRKASRPWRASAVALAAALVLGLPTQDALALALGRVSVQSTLGEPLRAEIDVPQITPDEVASLRASLASPDAFRAAGMERSAALADLQITLQQRPNGSYVLRLSSERVVSEPFVDLILEAAWGTGRIVRDYTLLFDPPASRPAAPVAAQVAPVPAPSALPAAAAPVPAPAPVAATGNPATRRDAAAPRSLTVQSGQTAGAIAAANKPATVSLDQMLVAMLRANPDAFIDSNVNRIKAGSVIDLPSQEQASAVNAAEARQTLVAQSRDFGEFRRRLAEGVATTPQTSTSPSRQASGRIEAQVQEKKPAEATPDKLTLSKGTVDGRNPTSKASEERIARERADRDMTTRLAELNKNIAELNRLGAASGSALPGSAASAAGVTAPTPTPTPAAASAAQAASAASPATATPAASVAAPPASLPASTPAPAAAPASRPPAAAAAGDGGVLGFLVDNPMIPAAVGAILALVVGLIALRLRRRKESPQVDSSFLESRLQPDSFFGASGGQRIDTAEDQAATGTSMVYSPSQIDAAGDVDPVAEADVYLAYGRDLQAEEILKEALRANPQRVAIHTKLLEIHARRRDVHAFELLAAEAHALTGGSGPQWSHIATLGRDLDPANPLYQGGSEFGALVPDEPDTFGEALADTERAPLTDMPSGQSMPAEAGPSTQPLATADEADEAQALAAAAHAPLDFDLSAIDLELPAVAAPAPEGEPPVPAPEAEALSEALLPELPADLPGALPPTQAEAPAASAPLPQALVDLDLDIPSLRPPSSPLPERFELAIDDDLDGDLPVAEVPRPVPPLSGMVDFDLSSISLDLEPAGGVPAAGAVPAPALPMDPLADLPAVAPELPTDLSTALPGDLPGAPTETDPLATKLALAEEFNAIGDIDGARSLAEEVRAEAQGELRQRAERLLGELG